MDRKTFLVLPNGISDEYEIRSYQMAEILADRNHCVYYAYIDRSRLKDDYCFRTTIEKLIAYNIINVNAAGKLNIINIPDISAELSFKCENYTHLIELIIEYFKIDIVINSSFDVFALPQKILDKIFYIYDISEDYLEIESNPVIKAYIGNFIENELYKAQLNISSSKTLANIYKKKYWTNIIYLPNGAAIKQETDSEMENIKKCLFHKYDITDNSTKIITALNLPAIGKKFDLLINAFNLLQKEISYPVKLIILLNNENEQCPTDNKDIIFINGLSQDDIRKHFIITDLGAVPLIKCNYTDGLLPINIIEYGMLRKPVLCAVTEELQNHNLPHIIFASNKVSSWTAAMKWGLELKWNEYWNPEIDKYRWDKLILLLERLIIRTGKK
ncbi:hypothetical protein KA977_12730 [Candidatus Dependentiae bacterium]|nr:hypothetical protein [Candidatus Dependentiae bacterium]